MKTKILMVLALFFMLSGFNGEDRIVKQNGVSLQKRVDEGVIPSFTRRPNAFSASDGSELIIKAEFIADPEPTVTWIHEGKIIIDGGRYRMIVNNNGGNQYIAMLIIKDPTEEDEGRYKVRLKNEFGETTANIELSSEEE